MASQNSKYASLPDIDSAPDVYETPDVPTEITHEYDSDSDTEIPRAGSPSARRGEKSGAPTSENIDAGRLDTGEARRRFGEASLGEEDDDFKATKRVPSRRLPSTRTYTIRSRDAPADEGKETTLERLRRLRTEIEQLDEDVRREKAETAYSSAPAESAATTAAKGKKKEVSPAVILQQLQMLRGDLGGVEGSLGVKEDSALLEATGLKEGTELLAQKARQTAGLLSRLGSRGGEVVTPTDALERKGSTLSPSPIPSASRKEPVETGQLEKRIAEVERVLGASEADIDEAHPLPPPLLQTLSRLDHLLTLLTQPRHLDSISRRVKVLVSDLERLHESRRKLGDTRPLNIALSGGMTVAVPGNAEGKGSTGPSPSVVGSLLPKAISGGGGGGSGEGAALAPDMLQKIDALFSLLPRLDPLLPLTPRLLTRLRSLATLHSSAAAFGEGLTNLRTEVERLGESERGLKQVVEGLEGSMTENENKVRANLEGLDDRFQSLMKRMEVLGL